MERIRELRNLFFEEVGKKRLGRIAACVLLISLLWTFTDLLGGIYEPKLRDDFICLILGVVLERMIPWGKI